MCVFVEEFLANVLIRNRLKYRTLLVYSWTYCECHFDSFRVVQKAALALSRGNQHKRWNTESILRHQIKHRVGQLIVKENEGIEYYLNSSVNWNRQCRYGVINLVGLQMFNYRLRVSFYSDGLPFHHLNVSGFRGFEDRMQNSLMIQKWTKGSLADAGKA